MSVLCMVETKLSGFGACRELWATTAVISLSAHVLDLSLQFVPRRVMGYEQDGLLLLH